MNSLSRLPGSSLCPQRTEPLAATDKARVEEAEEGGGWQSELAMLAQKLEKEMLSSALGFRYASLATVRAGCVAQYVGLIATRTCWHFSGYGIKISPALVLSLAYGLISIVASVMIPALLAGSSDIDVR